MRVVQNHALLPLTAIHYTKAKLTPDVTSKSIRINIFWLLRTIQIGAKLHIQLTHTQFPIGSRMKARVNMEYERGSSV